MESNFVKALVSWALFISKQCFQRTRPLYNINCGYHIFYCEAIVFFLSKFHIDKDVKRL